MLLSVMVLLSSRTSGCWVARSGHVVGISLQLGPGEAVGLYCGHRYVFCCAFRRGSKYLVGVAVEALVSSMECKTRLSCSHHSGEVFLT